MRTLTANIANAFLFSDRDFLERIDAARAAGFDKVECHFPYDVPIGRLKDRLASAGMRMTGLNTAPGDAARGEWGRAALPGREADFEQDFAQAMAYATGLGVPMIHVMAGVVTGREREEARAAYVSNLRKAAKSARQAGITLLLEPLNTRDKPDYLVSRSDEVVEVLRDIDEPNVKLLFDVYHVQIMEGDLIRRLERHRAHIGHVQIAAVPTRAEPDEGEVAYPAVFSALRAIGYAGLVGLEYKPRARTEDGLQWIHKICLWQ
jgi:hydroxypyruvate isomerase